MFNNFLDKSANGGPHIQMEQLSPAEAHVIHQLRQMILKRASYSQVVGRHEPLGHIRHEGRQYLEIREGFAPILVPSHMLDDVRAFLSENLPEHVRRLRGNRNTPPYTPQSIAGTTTSLQTAFSLDSINTSVTPQFTGTQSMSDASTPFPTLDDPVSPVNPVSPPFFQVPLPPASPPQVHSSSDVSQILSSSLPTSNNNSLGLDISASFTNTDLASLPMSQSSQMSSFLLPQQSVKEGKVTKRPAKSSRSKKQLRRNVSTSPSNSPEEDNAFDVDAFLTTALPGYTSAIAAAIENEARSLKSKKKSGASTSSSKMSKNPTTGGLDSCDNSMEVDEEASKALTISKNGEVEPDERLLRKPANAFILFRTDMNREMRAKQPKLSVEAASVTIGKLWKAADEATKTKYHDKAKRARDEYFNKKRLIQSIQRLKELDTINASEAQGTNDKYPASIPDAITQALTSAAATPAAKKQLVLTTTRDLGSFSPEAMGPLSAISHSEFTNLRANPVRPARSMTLDLDSQLLSGSSIGNSGPLTASVNARSFTSAGTGMGFGSGNSNSNDIGSYFNITSSAHDSLNSMFSESVTGSSVSAMVIDPSPILLDGASHQQPATDWITSTGAALSSSLQTIDEDNLEDVINSLLQKS